MATKLERITRFLRTNYYVLGVLGYLALLLYNYFRYGLLFQYSLGFYALFAIPVVVFVFYKKGKSQEFFQKWLPFLVILLSYEALQGIVGTMVKSGDLVHLNTVDEALVGVNLTGLVQQHFLSPAVTEISLFFYSLHFPLIVVASVFLWFARRSLFNKYALAMVMTSYVSLMVFLLMPSAPPWYQGVATNLVTAASQAPQPSIVSGSSILAGYIHLTSLIEADKFAAFPSLHAAYVILFCYFMMRYRSILGWVTIPVVFGVLFSTLYLGQHYLIDLIAGAGLALTSAVVSEVVVSRTARANSVRRLEVPGKI
jgi:inositol phosphorylceramide synthase catalytic subunit